MVKVDAIRQSPKSILDNSKNSRKAYDQTWNAAARAPVFCKITKKTTPDGKTKKMYRTSRLIGTHAFQIAASGAAMNASRILSAECDNLRLDVNQESSRAPWLPSVSKGAKMVLEQFLCALAQEAAYKGHAVREGSGNPIRLSKTHIKIGWDSTFDSVFGSAGLMPKTVHVLPLASKKKSTKKGGKEAPADAEEEDYTPPEVDNDMEGDAEDLAPEA